MSPDYVNFDCHDFAADPSFQKWVLNPDAADKKFWEDYLASHSWQTNIILDARDLVAGLKEISEFPIEENTAFYIWENIQTQLQNPLFKFFSSGKTWRIAASIIFLFGLSFFLFNLVEKSDFAKKNSISKNELVFTNESNQAKTIILPDKSKVSLSAKSKISYGNQFNRTLREVHLEGKAFFDIVPNPEKPFVVFTNELVTKVLGTSFTVSAYSNEKDVKVMVQTGRVSVLQRNEYEHSQRNEKLKLTGLILTPNQEAIFDKNSAKLNKTLVSNPKLISKKIEKFDFNFEEAKMAKVFQTLKNAYGIEIIYDQEVFDHCSISVSLGEEDLFQKLDIICKTIGASYQILDSQIIINGKGCK